ncbi:Uncharacterized protein GBIM_12507 [Gryllus bimaculatus]|nr:Uncharacterized protein GBIM_12507 [Gryllus bimaculatus]
MKPVRRLPSEVCSLVRSGVVIPTPSQAAVELVLNSIDAGATSIAVRVDLRIFKIQVVDNGHGISSTDLEEIGKRSVTSKCYTLDEFYTNLMYHGYRGESLASLREMCGLLEIVTRPADSNTTYSKVFVHGEEEKVKISDLKRPTHGTTITITDFMFNMPVRRKRIKEAVELEAIRSCLECIALAHPEISLSIRNDVKGRIIMEKHKSSDLLNAFEHLFGHNLARMLAAVNFSTEKFKISGYIGKEPYRHNDLQFIFVNRQPIIKTKLHKLVSALLSKSSIVRTNGPWKNKPIPKDVPVERWLSFSSLEKQKKFAVFVINITCARKEYERCWDAKMPLIYFKDWEGIISCVSSAIQEFLKLENLIDDDDLEHGKSEDETGNYISSVEEKPQSSHTSVSLENVSKVNHQKDIEVETWNIQGAIHGIYAKRPKECTTEFTTGVCVKSDDQKMESINEINRQFRTPGTINSSQECLQNELESVPPVVKFLKKYETPAASRLQITKGAYRLKQKEEEEKKRAVAKMLGTFKFPRKSKLISSKNCENVQNGKLTCTKYVKMTNEPSFLQQKIKEHKNIKELNTKVGGPVVSKSSDTLSLQTGKYSQLCSNSRHQNQVNACLLKKKSQICMDSESSADISNYFSFSPSSTGDTNANTTLCMSSDNFSFTSTEEVSSYENEDSNGIALCNDSERFPLQSPVDESNVHVNDSFHQSFMKSVNPCKNPSYCDKRDGNVFSNNENVFVLKHGSGGSSPSVKDTQEFNNDISCVNENAKNCANLVVSKTLVLSIPTPQSKIIPVQTATSSEMMDKFHCSKKRSLRHQASLADCNENHYSLCKPQSSFVNVCKSPCQIDDHISDSRFDELFASQEDNFSSVKENLRKQNMSMVIPSLVNNCVNKSQKSVECSHNVSDAKNMFMPSFEQENGTNEWTVHGVGEQVKTVKQTNVSNLKKDRNIRDVFETFEKHVTPGIIESVSPYFSIKNNSVNYKEPVKYSFNLEGINKNNDTDDKFRQNNKREECDELLSVLNVAGTEQHMELFSDVDKSKEFSDKGINVRPVINFLFSGSSSESNLKSCTKELEEASCVDISQTSSQTKGSASPSNGLMHCNELKENFSHAIDVPKRRRLSPSKSDVETNIEDRLFAALKKTEEVIKEDQSFDSCVTSKCENMNACNQADSVLPKEDQCQKETENSVDKIADKDWLQVRNLKGKLFYFHTPSGFTTYHVPSIAKDASIYSMSKRCQFLPKGMSPLLAIPTDFHSTFEQQSFPNVSADASRMIKSSSDNDDLKTVKWREKPDIFNNNISDVLSITEGPSDKKMLSSNTSIPDLSSVTSKMCTMVLKQKLDKRIFSNIQVVGQLDNKFIITLCSEDKNSNPHILGIFDQHAVHERVRLEALMKAYSSNEDEWSFTATDLDEPVVLNRSSQWLKEILHILIQDVVLFLIKTGGQDIVVPEVFKEVINSEACKGAIKFGDPLSVVECESLLLDLSKCDLPFYCAHGRPSFMPLFDLREFEEERQKHIQGY